MYKRQGIAAFKQSDKTLLAEVQTHPKTRFIVGPNLILAFSQEVDIKISNQGMRDDVGFPWLRLDWPLAKISAMWIARDIPKSVPLRG